MWYECGELVVKVNHKLARACEKVASDMWLGNSFPLGTTVSSTTAD